MRNYIIIAIAALGIAACQPSNDVSTNNNYVASENHSASVADCGIASDTVVDEKILIAAETAFNIPAHAYVTFNAANKLSPEIKAVAQPALLKAYGYLKLARQAYNTGDGCNLKQYSDLAQAFANKAKAAMPAK